MMQGAVRMLAFGSAHHPEPTCPTGAPALSLTVMLMLKLGGTRDRVGSTTCRSTTTEIFLSKKVPAAKGTKQVLKQTFIWLWCNYRNISKQFTSVLSTT